MILVDSNIPMRLVGDGRPHKRDAQRIPERLVKNGERLATNGERLVTDKGSFRRFSIATSPLDEKKPFSLLFRP